MNLVIGKFYPPHEGHHWLIDQALADGPTIVAIMWSEQESIRPGLRKKWLRDAHGYLVFVIVKDELPVDFNNKALSSRHADLIQRELAHLSLDHHITKVFGCEPYVEHLADYFRARPVRLDRSHIPISGTQIREDPRQHWDYLRPATKAGLCKRIVCIGAESCGTTTLAKDLAEHYQTVWVPEYGRLYSEGLTTGAWHHEDLDHIASAQRSLEEALARRSEHGLLICDTNELATQVWGKFLVGGSSRIKPIDHPTLYLVTDLCPWEDDGMRFMEHRREEMQAEFLNCTKGLPRIIVTGDRQERLEQATKVIDALTWNFGPPIC